MAEIKFTERFDMDYPAGHFDMSLNLIDGNSLIYRLFGSRVYFSIYKLLTPDEQEKVSDMAKRCLELPDSHFEECVHIDNGDATDCYVIKMQKTVDRDTYDVEFINVTQSKNLIRELNHHIIMARDYLTLYGESIFTYTPSNNNFHLFIVNSGQNVDLFNMDFDEWMEIVKDKKLIVEDEWEAFETFGYVLKNATVSQCFTFHGSAISTDNTLEKYRVAFSPKQEYYGEKIVLGTWVVLNGSNNETESSAFEAACIDGLTGLLNKKAITRYAEKAIENAGKNGHQVALAMMDVDNFKGVNDNFGHLFGDKVIKAVGEVIKYAIGSDAVAGRMGGDEFLIVFERFDDELEYRNVLRCIRTKVNYVYADKFVGSNKLSCSIGLGRYGIGSCSSTYNDLFKIADKALYLAKQKGKNRYIIYKPELHGDFNSDGESGDDTVRISKTYYSDEDVDKINSLISDTIVYGSEVIANLIDKLANVLMLDRINVFTGNRAIPDFTNTSVSGSDRGFSNPTVLGDAQYLSIFNKNKIIITNIHGIEYTLPETFQKFSDAGIGSLMQYILVDRNGKVSGLISAEIFENFIAFPKIAIQLFEITCRTINSVLIREGKI